MAPPAAPAFDPPRASRRAAHRTAVVVCALAAGALLLGPPHVLASSVLGSFEAEIQRLRERLQPSVACVEARRPRSPVLVGAGVIADSAGIVVTTASVVRDASEVLVRVPDRGEFAARVVGSDPITNLAVLQLEGSGFVPAILTTSAGTPPGSWVMVLGNSYGAGPTVSVGVLAGRRPCYGIDEREGLLQINAAVNPGDSGGALVNSRGDVIGIVCAALTPRENPAAASLVGGGSEGQGWGSGATVGFAVPMGAGRAIVDEIRAKGRVVRGYLGIQIHILAPEKSPAGPRVEGPALLVTGVVLGAPAERAGFRVGDVILAVNGKSIDSPRRLQRLVEATAPASPLSVSILREGSPQALTAVVDEMPVSFAEQRLAPRAEGPAAPPEPSGQTRAELGRRIEALEAELSALRNLLGSAPPPPRP